MRSAIFFGSVVVGLLAGCGATQPQTKVAVPPPANTVRLGAGDSLGTATYSSHRSLSRALAEARGDGHSPAFAGVPDASK